MKINYIIMLHDIWINFHGNKCIMWDNPVAEQDTHISKNINEYFLCGVFIVAVLSYFHFCAVYEDAVSHKNTNSKCN